jgi:hypothetical protein
MKLNKRQAFIFALSIWLSLSLLYQSLWLFSRTATAEIYAADSRWGHGSIIGGRIGRRRIPMEFATYSVASITYKGVYFRNEHDVDAGHFEIRYLIFDPSITRKNTFAGNWAYTLIFFFSLSLITFIIYVRKDIVADQAVFVIQGKRPFIQIEKNTVEDYDEHDIASGPTSEAEQALKKRIEKEVGLFQKTEVSASIYKFNPNAIGIFVAYIVPFFWFFQILVTEKSVGPGIIFLGAVLVFVPLFVQNTNNPTFKAKIPDEGSLLLSNTGVQYKDEFYSADDIEAAVVYLEAFQGFEYQERVVAGGSTTVSRGDNNKISFRYKGQVIDFTFILDQFADYWSFRNLMYTWAGRGINVVMEKVFEDEFVIQQMVKFNTPVTYDSAIV